MTDQLNTWTIIRGRSAQHPRGDPDNMLKSNGPNSISKSQKTPYCNIGIEGSMELSWWTKLKDHYNSFSTCQSSR